MQQKHIKQKKNIDKMDFIKIKNLVLQGHHYESEKTLKEWAKVQIICTISKYMNNSYNNKKKTQLKSGQSVLPVSSL